ncbi:uncharacterized protein LOC116852660 [Odontomachus brunneus]|uniref:uncharacterized protein LOC116852660 n=1 Tax=Odontomachus brunneus TaxID=486640 RepID=UPI0013F2A33D|nr:uncharacterized protein LOC116852660 [Odontomachus brunneus]
MGEGDGDEPALMSLVNQFQQWIAVRLSRTYRTTSHMAATALAGLPSLELLDSVYVYVYRTTRERREGEDQENVARVIARMRKATRQRLLQGWQKYLEGATGNSGNRVAEAIRPCLQQWVGRVKGELFFRTTQVLTGHCCFGEYLNKIEKDHTTRCHHCNAAVDSAQHTLEVCLSWVEQRRVLTGVVGAYLSPSAFIKTHVRARRGLVHRDLLLRRRHVAEGERGKAKWKTNQREGPEDKEVLSPLPAHKRGIEGKRAEGRHSDNLLTVPTPGDPPDAPPPGGHAGNNGR